MGLPVALGGKRSSRKVVAPASPPDEQDTDGTTLQFTTMDAAGSPVAFATTPDRYLLATISISYFRRIRVSQDGSKCFVGVTAVLQIQIAQLAASFSTADRTIEHKVHMPTSRSSTASKDDSVDGSQLLADAVFAGDGSHLACLIPYPTSSGSIVVTFQLRKPRRSSVQPTHFSLPSALWRIPPVATNPHLVHQVENNTLRPFYAATCLCDVTTTLEDNPMSFLLAGCQNGTVLAIAYRLDGVVGLVHAPSSDSTDPVVKLAHAPSSTEKGQLLLIDSSGKTTIFQSEFKRLFDAQTVDRERRQVLLRRSSSHKIPEAMEATFRFGLLKHCDCEGVSIGGCWIDFGVLALLHFPKASDDVVARVFCVPEETADLFCHSTLILKPNRLLDTAHSIYPLPAAQNHQTKDRVALRLATHLAYDERSGSVVIASYKVVRLAGGVGARLFTCIWNWSRNVTSLIVRANGTVALDRTQRCTMGEALYQHSHFAVDQSNRQYLTIISGRIAVDSGASLKSIRKDTYSLATMSPSASTSKAKWFEMSSNVILGSSSVFVPVMVKPTAKPDFEISWNETNIPASYVAKFGSPPMAVVGTNSVAIASTRGICVLRFDAAVSNSGVKGKTTSLRWRRFPEIEEIRIHAKALALWEGCSGLGEETSESAELLLAVVLVEADGSQAGKDIYYLSCWNRKWLDLSHQLIVGEGEEFGVRLQDGFDPTRISIVPKNSNPRQAVVLVSNDASELTIYELKLQDGKRSVDAERDAPTFHVEISSLSGSGTIRQHPGYVSRHSSYLFLASVSFRMAEFVATIGVVDMARPGVGAVPWARNTFGTQLISSVTRVGVSSLSLSNIVEATETDSIFYWSIDLCNGKRICWVLPRFSRDTRVIQSASFGSTYQINKGNSKNWLGSVSLLGNSTMWMHGSTVRTHAEWLMDNIPGGKFGYLLRAGQGTRNVLRNGWGGNLRSPGFAGLADQELFCIGETQVTMPAKVASVVSTLTQPEESSLVEKDKVIAHIDRIFRSRGQGEASRIIVTVIVLRLVELKATSTAAESELLSLLYRRIMVRMRKSMDDLTVSTIFLSLARQVEPSSLHYLFPLPQMELTEERSVKALVNSALQEGSVGTPSASAQLLSRDASLELSRDLLYWSGQRLWRTTRVSSRPTFDSCRLERNISASLLRFGFRLEDAGAGNLVRGEMVGPPAAGSVASSMIPPSPRTKKEVKKAASLFPYGLFCRSRRRRAENEVDEAASVFVMSGFGESEEEDYEFISMNSSVVPGSISHSSCSRKGSSLATVGAEMLLKVGTDSADDKILHWKALSVMAKVLRPQNETFCNEPNRVSSCQPLVKSFSTRDLFRAVEVLEERADGQGLASSGRDIEDRIVDFLVGNIVFCEENLNREEAECIREASHALLSRLDGRATRNKRTQLLMVCIVASHVTGSGGAYFDSGSLDYVPLAALYTLAVSEISER